MRDGLRAAREIYGMSPQAELIDAETIPGAHVRSDAEIDLAIREFGGKIVPGTLKASAASSE